MVPTQQQSSVIPESCSSEQLFKDAEEVVKLSTDLAGLEDQFDRLFLKHYMDAPQGFSEKARETWALQTIKDEHGSLWTEIDAMRARYRGLTLKSQIVRAATHVVAIEHEIGLHSQV